MEIRKAVIGQMIEIASRHSPDPILNRERASKLANQLYNELEETQRERTKGAEGLTRKLFRDRLDCFIFFSLIEKGWGQSERLTSGAVKVRNCPLSSEVRLGIPSQYRLWRASRRVRMACPFEAQKYKREYRAWKEARRRYLATESDAKWGKYYRRVVYYSRIARTRRGGREHFKRRLYRYMSYQLLPRQKERHRALIQMWEADVVLCEMRQKILDVFEVPDGLRRL